jgi:hypothetical protein
VPFNQFLEIWSSYVSKMKDGIDPKSFTCNIEPVNTSSPRRALDAMLSASQPDNAPQHFQQPIFPTKAPLPTIRTKPYKVTAKILCLPAPSIAALKADLQAFTTTRISAFTTISALLWANTIHARSHALRDAGCTTVSLASNVHLGQRAGPALPASYSGNLALTTTTSFSLLNLLDLPAEMNQASSIEAHVPL